MINDIYSYYPSKNFTQFAFQSEGIKGKIVKIIIFSPIAENEWNLGFGDFHRGKLDDTTMTNNNDAMKTIRTVAQAILIFIETYPDRIVVIEPLDEKRKRFYNRIFQKFYDEINIYFNIIGIREGVSFVFNPKEFYDVFKISYKFVKS